MQKILTITSRIGRNSDYLKMGKDFQIQIMILGENGKPTLSKSVDGDQINNMRLSILKRGKFIPQMKVQVGKSIMKNTKSL